MVSRHLSVQIWCLVILLASSDLLGESIWMYKKSRPGEKGVGLRGNIHVGGDDSNWGGTETQRYYRSDLEQNSEYFIPTASRKSWTFHRPSRYEIGKPLPQAETAGKNGPDGMPSDIFPSPLTPPVYTSKDASVDNQAWEKCCSPALSMLYIVIPLQSSKFSYRKISGLSRIYRLIWDFFFIHEHA